MQSIFLQLPFYSRWSVSPSSGNEKPLYNPSPALTHHDIFFAAGGNLPTDQISSASSQLSRTTRLKNRLRKALRLDGNTTANAIIREWEREKGRIETNRVEIFKTLNKERQTFRKQTGCKRKKPALGSPPQPYSAPAVNNRSISIQGASSITQRKRKQHQAKPLTTEKIERLQRELSEIFQYGKDESEDSFQRHSLWQALQIRGTLEGKRPPYPQIWVDEVWKRKRQGH